MSNFSPSESRGKPAPADAPGRRVSKYHLEGSLLLLTRPRLRCKSRWKGSLLLPILCPPHCLDLYYTQCPPPTLWPQPVKHTPPRLDAPLAPQTHGGGSSSSLLHVSPSPTLSPSPRQCLLRSPSTPTSSCKLLHQCFGAPRVSPRQFPYALQTNLSDQVFTGVPYTIRNTRTRRASLHTHDSHRSKREEELQHPGFPRGPPPQY